VRALSAIWSAIRLWTMGFVSGAGEYPVDPKVGNVRNNELGLCEVYECSPNSA
jgi:hypothetical protein